MKGKEYLVGAYTIRGKYDVLRIGFQLGAVLVSAYYPRAFGFAEEVREKKVMAGWYAVVAAVFEDYDYPTVEDSKVAAETALIGVSAIHRSQSFESPKTLLPDIDGWGRFLSYSDQPSAASKVTFHQAENL